MKPEKPGVGEGEWRRRIREKRRGKEWERGRGEEGERMIGIEEGREGCFLAMRVQEIVRRREGKVDWRSVNEENKGEEEKGKEGKRVDEEERGRGGENEKRGRPGGAVFLVMQVLKIPAGGRGFPLVHLIHIWILILVNFLVSASISDSLDLKVHTAG